MEHLSLVFLHIVSGFLWAGGAFVQGFFVVPALLEAGPAGGAVMAGITKRRFVPMMTATSVVALLSGARLYSLRFSSAWLTSAEGIVLTLGMLLAIGGAVIGMARQRPTAEKMAALARTIGAAGGPPSPEQAAEMTQLGTKLARLARINAYHLLAALVLMASHRLATAF